MFKNLFTMDRQEIDALLDSGYGDYIYRATVVGPLMSFAGVASAFLFPASAERLIAYFTGTLAGSGLEALSLETMSTLETFGLIFINNLSAAFSALFWGLIPFLYLTAFTLGINFYLLGVFTAAAQQSGTGMLTYFLSIAPHGIFELPAIILFSAAGLYLCRAVTMRLRGRSDIRITMVLSACIRFLWTAVAPLLFFSALIETFLTPFLLKLVL